MSEQITITSRVPRNDDSVAALLARSISGVYTRSTYIPSTGSVSTTTTGVSIDTRCMKALWLSVNVSAIIGGSLAIQIQYQDPVSGAWAAVWTSSTAISAAGTYFVVIGDCAAPTNAAVTPGAVIPCTLPGAVRVALVPTGATYTASVGLEIV